MRVDVRSRNRRFTDNALSIRTMFDLLKWSFNASMNQLLYENDAHRIHCCFSVASKHQILFSLDEMSCANDYSCICSLVYDYVKWLC